MQSLNLTSRADLLRELKCCQQDSERSVVAKILGYEKVVVQHSEHQHSIQFDDNEKNENNKLLDLSKAGGQAALSEKIPDERFIVLQSRELYADPDSLQDGLPECLQGVKPLSEADLKPKANGVPLLYEPLVQQQRLLPFLKRSLVYPLGDRLDVARLVKKVARLEVLQRIPRKAHILPAGRVYVLLDLNKRLLPFWQDSHQLCDLLARKLGKNGLDIRVLETVPGGRYSNWFDEDPALQDWQTLKSPSSVLIVSDLGGLANNESLRTSWLTFVRQLGRKTIRPIVLTPCVQKVCTEFRLHVDLVAWGRGSHFKKQTVCRVNPDFFTSVRRVLGLLSVAVHVEPVLLRAVLSCLPVHEADSDVEAAIYIHEDLVWGHTAVAVKAEKRDEYRAVFKDEDAEIQRQVLLLIRQHHVGQFPFVWASTLLNAQPLVKFAIDELPDADVKWAKDLMQRFTRSFSGQVDNQGMRQFAQRELQRLGIDDEGKILKRKEYASFLYGFAYRDQLLRGDEIPQEHDANLVQAAIRESGDVSTYQLIQRGEYLFVQSEGPIDPFLQIGSHVTLFESRQNFLSFRLDDDAWKIHRFFTSEPICHITRLAKILLDTGTERLLVMRVAKPSWAYEIRRNEAGVSASIYFLNKSHIFYPDLVKQNTADYLGRWRPANREAATKNIEMNNIFISYSHKDVVFKDKLVPHLKALQGPLESVTTWSDLEILPGDSFSFNVELAIASAKVVILLVSENLLASDYMMNSELERFLRSDKNAGFRLIPLILSPCPWLDIPWLAELQTANKDGIPLSQFPNQDLELNEIAMRVQRALQTDLGNDQVRGSPGQLLPESPRQIQSKSDKSANNFEDTVYDLDWDKYGLYADLTIQNTTQRFRWIEPGEFMMGSPDNEEGRDNDEDLHQVTLTKGFWLADTTVTQALWEAVMNETPSHFKNPNNPVENISWNDCQQFIEKLNDQIAGLRAKLPTEAQWEYACRAGTNTSFFFGAKEDLDLGKVNYSGKWDEYDSDGKTKAVKSHLSNDWGLYEMHGNVLEWCEDVWQENLGTESSIDPLQKSSESKAGAGRVVRGGSWDSFGRYCRSAIRDGREPGYRGNGFIGFRLSLGHVQPGAGGTESVIL